MKLYDVPRNSKIKIGDNILDFKSIDGMYSLCYTEDGEPIHPVCWTEVELVEREEE